MYLIGKLACSKWVRPAIQSNLECHAPGKGNRARRRMGLAVEDYAPGPHAMNRSELALFLRGR